MAVGRYRTFPVVVVVASLLSFWLPSVATAVGPHQAHGSLVVRTEQGAVRGTRGGGVDSFLGIRYAAPPVGELRWKPPRPARPWTGVRAATSYGNRCPAEDSVEGPRSETEDCLFVNVQRPTGLRPDAHRPVYVFIHGGSFLRGSSNQYDSAPLVHQTGVVAVTLNYRLGVFGFMANPGLTKEGGESGNYGLMDQQAALTWVQRNIALFGGDPDRVTIGGQSAGGMSVCAHLAAPGSRGLYARALIESGSCFSLPQDLEEALWSEVPAAVGCDDAADLACLRAASVGALLDAPRGLPAPVSGTGFLPLDPREAISTGQFSRVPTVIGANRDEGRSFSTEFIGSTQGQYVDWVNENFPDTAEAVLARYPWPAAANEFTAAYLIGAILTDSSSLFGIGGCGGRQLSNDLARYTRTWAYEFNHRTGPGAAPEPIGYVWGAGHWGELPYLYSSFNHGTPIAATFDGAERQLARDMKRYWGAFVMRADPNVAGQTTWKPYQTGKILSLQAGSRSKSISDARFAHEHNCEFWDNS